jgi:hypothetical protein
MVLWQQEKGVAVNVTRGDVVPVGVSVPGACAGRCDARNFSLLQAGQIKPARSALELQAIGNDRVLVACNQVLFHLLHLRVTASTIIIFTQ